MKIGCIFLVVLGTAACSLPPNVPISSSPSPLRNAAVGCWQLESSPGLLGRPLPPTLVRLDTAAFAYGGMRMIVFTRQDRRRLDRWGTDARGDSLHLSFSNGFSGVHVRAFIRGDQLRGRGRTWVDTSAPARRGRVRGIRVPCPAEPAAE